MIVVDFPDEASLRAAVRAVADIVNAEGGTDMTTPYYRAERALDGALLAHEQATDAAPQ